MRILKKTIIKLKCLRMRSRFYHFGKRSGFGTYGYGNKCKLVGCDMISVGDGSWFGDGSEVICYKLEEMTVTQAKLSIGNHVSVTARVRITCAGRITIKDDVLIAPDVFITDHNHGMDPAFVGGYSMQPLIVRQVIIEEGVWLGQRVCVLPGVTIGAHSIIGANSVVTHDIPAYSVAVGSPAKVVKRWDFETKTWKKI